MNDIQSRTPQEGYDVWLVGGAGEHPPHITQPSYQPLPSLSPSPSASPFAFAPPPLWSTSPSVASRPSLVTHHSEPLPLSQSLSYTNMKPQDNGHGQGYQYIASVPVSYRSYSGENDRHSPSQTSTLRPVQVTAHVESVPSQSSPLEGSIRYQQHQFVGEQYDASLTDGPSRTAIYQPSYYVPSHSEPTFADMPRSLSYSASYAQPYAYLPSSTFQNIDTIPTELVRHNTLGAAASLYSFGKQPIQDRPFKCDKCTQSFNRNHDLKRHKRIHLSVKPFGCEKCGKTFSRKDALRRHWLVKGCKGAEGATAPIVAGSDSKESVSSTSESSKPPALSPPTPSTLSPTEASSVGKSPTKSSSRSVAPPPLTTLPPRHSADQSQIIMTPSDISSTSIGASSMGETGTVLGMNDGSIGMVDTLVSSVSTGSVGSMGEGFAHGEYKSLQLDKANGMIYQSKTSPYLQTATSLPQSGGIYQHSNHRPTLSLASPDQNVLPSPTDSSYQSQTFSPSSLSADEKPNFALPSAHFAQAFPVLPQNAISPPLKAVKMEETWSSTNDTTPETWQRWHRPPFPYPASPGFAYMFDSSARPAGNNASNQFHQPPPQ
ncbi:hypothetical protein L204_104071 [Cryptococcus depauperatus]|nr:hypothetical protein L204_03224 [Cryptococcus depauperatus CBS 7855]